MERLLAQELQLPGITGTPIQGPLTQEFGGKFYLGDVVAKVMPYVFAAAGMGLLLMLISAGFTFLTSAGDAKKLESGKQRLTSALMGFIIIFAAYWIVQILGKIFGIEEINKTFL